MTSPPLERWVVRPGQLRAGDLRAGIVQLRDDWALIQANAGRDGTIHRARLTPGESTGVDGWTVRLQQIDTSGRGSVLLQITPPPAWPAPRS